LRYHSNTLLKCTFSGLQFRRRQWVYLHPFSCYCLRNTRNVAKVQENLTLQQFNVIDLGVNRKPICEFLLVIVTLAVSATVFEIFTLKDRKLLILPTLPLFDAPARGEPLEFLDETYRAITTWMGLPYGENFIILTSTVLYDPPV